MCCTLLEAKHWQRAKITQHGFVENCSWFLEVRQCLILRCSTLTKVLCRPFSDDLPNAVFIFCWPLWRYFSSPLSDHLPTAVAVRLHSDVSPRALCPAARARTLHLRLRFPLFRLQPPASRWCHLRGPRCVAPACCARSQMPRPEAFAQGQWCGFWWDLGFCLGLWLSHMS